MPDEELTEAGGRGQLARSPSASPEQVERLLESPKAAQFTRNFTGQWLDLRDIDFTGQPDANLYPEYDELLRISMVRETELFFEEVLRAEPERHALRRFGLHFPERASGRALWNSPVSKGQAFRRVTLPADERSRRAADAGQHFEGDGQRNVHLSGATRRLDLGEHSGQPTPPPPDNVGSVEPDIRGATTIREQLARHRNIDPCAVVSSQIDPPGFALESFDPIGGLRGRVTARWRPTRPPRIDRRPRSPTPGFATASG